MDRARLRVAVIGCGIAGPAAALFLSRAGHDVVVYDRAKDLGPLGAGILLAPSGLYVLERLGLLGAALEQGSRVQRLEGDTAAGKKIMDLRYRHFGTALFGLGILRGSLFSILMRAMEEQGIDVVASRQADTVVDGQIVFDDGEREGPFDLIVIADGARSSLRRKLSLETRCSEYEYGALWASTPNWGEFPDNVLRQVYRGTRQMAGFLPSGRLGESTGRRISLFWSIAVADVPQWRDQGLDAWKRQVRDLVPAADALLEDIAGPDQVTVATYYDVRNWSLVKDRCVLLGDAAHAMSPQLGQGASLALFDAMVLAQCVKRERFVLPALLTYEGLRRDHTRFYQFLSRWMTPFFQSRHDFLSLPRDWLLPLGSRLDRVRDEMAATMGGTKTGLLGKIAQEEGVKHMGAKFAFGTLVREDPPVTSLVRW